MDRLKHLNIVYKKNKNIFIEYTHYKMANIFELTTQDVLGSGFRSYLTDVRALSLTNPKAYFLLRKEISTKLVDVPVSMIYRTIFLALSAGTNVDGGALSDVTPYGKGRECLVPQFPSQKANIVAMRLAQILEEELEQVLSTLLPLSFDNVASTSLSLATRNTMTNGAASSSSSVGAGSGSLTASSS